MCPWSSNTLLLLLYANIGGSGQRVYPVIVVCYSLDLVPYNHETIGITIDMKGEPINFEVPGLDSVINAFVFQG